MSSLLFLLQNPSAKFLIWWITVFLYCAEISIANTCDWKKYGQSIFMTLSFAILLIAVLWLCTNLKTGENEGNKSFILMRLEVAALAYSDFKFPANIKENQYINLCNFFLTHIMSCTYLHFWLIIWVRTLLKYLN
jgi:hypothetical protein